ncbi:winged helix DNA-binding domain-containing protein [soil metagenome]
MTAHVDDAQRRARLGRLHALAGGCQVGDLADATDAVVGLHATDPCTVFMSVWARVEDVLISDIETALYDERAAVRMLGMRRTMFVVPLGTWEAIHESSTRHIAARERRRSEQFIAAAGIVSDPGGWFEALCEDTLTALRSTGGGTTAEVTPLVEGLETRVPVGVGTANEAAMSVASRVLFQLGAEGRVVRGRPQGSWVSSQYRWVPTEDWVDLPRSDLDVLGARVALVRRYLAAFGPATESDVVWWTGWTKTDARAALAALEVEEVTTDHGVAYVLATDTAPHPHVETWVALLPSLDPTTMGWKERSWYLGDHGPALFDRNGNAGPTVWVDGRVVGGWGQVPGGEVAWRLVEDVPAEAEAAIAERAAELTEWLGGKVVMPRFPTPMQKDIASG